MMRLVQFKLRHEREQQMRASFQQRDFPATLRLNFAATELAPTIYRSRCILHGIEPIVWSDLAPALKTYWIAQAADVLTRNPQ